MTGRCLIPVLLLALLLTSCSEPKPTPAAAGKAAASQPDPPAVAKETADQAYVASGPLVVENQVDVAAQREGVIAEVSADIGTSVRKGQVLARLDDRQISADHEAASAKARSIVANIKNWESEVRVLQADLDRAEQMWKENLITKQALDHARFKVEADLYEVEAQKEHLRNAEAAKRSLELELEKTRVRAPFDGLVARRYVRAGQRVGLGDRLFWVTAVAPLRIRFNLPESVLGRIRVADQVSVTPVALPEKAYSARILQVSPVVDPASGTVEVLAEVVGPAGDLRPGMTATVRFEPQR